MLHVNTNASKEDKTSEYKAKLGVKMFFVYALIYTGFIVINTVKPTLMEFNLLGMNLATLYGFGLIIFALVQAYIYNRLCTKAEQEMNK